MKVSFFKSLRFRMPFLVLSGILPLMSIAILISTANASKTILQESQENLILKAQLLARNISSWDEANVLALLNLNKQPDIINENIENQKIILSELVDTFSQTGLIV